MNDLSSSQDPAESASTKLVSPSRRGWIYASVAGLAAMGGAGVAWRKYSLQPEWPNAAQGMTELEFETPAGPLLALRTLAGKPLVLNFWATWCPPCVQELPMLNAFYQQNHPRGWQVVGLAIDQPSAVRAFLARVSLDFPVGLAGVGGTELARSLGNLTGGLPFTAVFAADGKVVHRKMGQATAADMQLWASLAS